MLLVHTDSLLSIVMILILRRGTFRQVGLGLV